MITRFDSLFAGHVDMDNVGYAGTPVNDRWFPDEYLATVFDKAEAIAGVMEQEGYDTLWMAEHHFQREGYECIPNVLMLALHLAHLTRRLRFGCGFNITPMWHPLRLAEDFATADWLTRGRIIFGVGRGYHTREVETFDAPLRDQAANRDLFEEQVEIIFKAFNQRSFSHQGKYYTLPPRVPYRGYDLEDLTLVPRPRTLPVECWQPIQGATHRGLDFMAQHGIKGIIGGGVAEGGAMDNVVTAFRDALARAGRENPQLGEDLSFGFHFYLCDNPEKGVKEAARYYEENLKMFGPLRLVRSLSDAQIEAMSDPQRAPHAGLPTLEEAVQKGGFLCGPPERVVETLKALEARYPGLERVNVGHPVGTPQKEILEQLQWFGREVIPAFQQPVADPVPAD